MASDDEKPPYGAFAFGWFLVDDHHTRLVVRTHLRHHWTDHRIWLDLFTEFGDHVAVPRMLAGVRDRVEGRRIHPLALEGVEIGTWMAAHFEFALGLLLIMIRRAWWKLWIAAFVSGAAVLFVLYAQAPVWAGALLQVPVLAALTWAWKERSEKPA